MSMIEAEVLAAGATAATSAGFTLDATLGQPVTGPISNAAAVCQGFWCDYVPQAIVGPVTVLYRITFGQIDITLALLSLVAIVATRWLYDQTDQLWNKQPSRSRPATR